MAAIRMRLRAELRGRWRGVLGLAVLLGLAGGAALTSAAGARRTSSAYSRLIVHNAIADVLVNPDAGHDSALTASGVARLPQVERAASVEGILLASLTKQGYPDLTHTPITLAGVEPSFDEAFNRPRAYAGRLADNDAVDEAMVDTIYASKTHIRPGRMLTMYWPTDLEHTAVYPSQGPPPSVKPFRFRVTGVVVDPHAISSDQGFQDGYIFLTPAFWAAHPETSAGYWGEMVKLRRGAADIPAFRRSVEHLVPGESIAFQTLPATRDKTQRTLRPYADALTFFAVAVALAGLLITGQTLARQLFVGSADHPTLSAIGFSRGQLFLLGMLRAAIVGLGGAAIAVGLALALSPLFPIGPGRLAEPTPGFALDLHVLTLGAATVVVSTLLLAVGPSLRGARTATAKPGDGMNGSRVADALARAGAPAPATVGARLAMEPGRGRTSVPVRTTIGAAAIGIASVMGALTFGSGLTHLATTPRLYGWNWSVMIAAPSDPHGDPLTPDRSLRDLEDVLAADRSVGGWSRLSISEAVLDGRPVVSVGIESIRGRVLPTVAAGRVPRADDEVALGAVTMRKLGVSIGGRVVATQGSTRRTLTVVGRVVLPGLGNYPGSDKTALGEGAVLTRRAVYDLGPAFGVSLLVRFRPGIEPSRAAAELQPKLDALPIPQGGDAPTATSVQRPSDVQNYANVRATPIGLAAVLGLLAIGAVAHALGAAVRRRSRDLAVLKTMGMVRRQIRTTVAWQASAVAIAALAIGVPTGVIVGRWAWSAFATQLGTVAEPRVPLVVVFAAIPIVLLACNLVAAVPGRRAGRTRPALILRAE